MLKKRSSWLYIFFGVYPISLFDLGNSEISLSRQVAILSFITSGFLIIAHIFNVLSTISFMGILLFVITPYLIGRLFNIGIIE